MSREAEVFDYEGAIWGLETVRPGERTIAGFRLAEALRFLPERGRVLEVGCGAGRFLRGVARARPGLQLCGVDLSQAALARAAAASPGLELRAVASPGAALPAADAEFDAVLGLDVLEHVPDPGRILAELRRVLAQDGVLHLHVPCEGDPTSLWRWLPGQGGPRGLKRRLAGHVQHFRRRQVLALLEAQGFEILRVRHSLHVIGNLADVGVFLALAAARMAGSAPRTTGDLVAGASDPVAAGSAAALAIRAVDRLLWLEARLLGRLPSWGLHVSARKRARGGAAGGPLRRAGGAGEQASLCRPASHPPGGSP